MAARRAGLAAIVALAYGACVWWPNILTLLGVGNLGIWFLDMEGALAASDAHALGFDPHGHNALDVFHRPHLYSNWWYAFHFFGVSRADYVWVGGILVAAFLIFALLQLKTRSMGEVAWSAAILVAPPMLFGFARGNADLTIFVLLSLVPLCLSSPHPLVRWLALVPLLISTGLKFYPAIAALALLTANRPRREIRLQIAIFAVGVLAIAASVFGDLAVSLSRYTAEQPSPSFYCFGFLVASRLMHLPAWWNPMYAAMFGLVAIMWWRWAPKFNFTAFALHEPLMFVIGAALLVGCFFSTINYSYRAAFAVWLAPLIWTGWSAPSLSRAGRCLIRLTGALLLVWLWSDGAACLVLNAVIHPTEGDLLIWAPRFILLQQPLVLCLMIALLGLLVAFVRDNLAEYRSTDLARHTRPTAGATAAPV